jgi:V/A-type H+-transporting ATPase subunit C
MGAPDPLFAYMNARVRALKSQLFSRAQFEELLRQDDLERMTNALLDSAYHTELTEALSRFKGADAIEEAVTRHFVTMAQMLVARSQDRPRELLITFLMRWDLRNVKSLLRIQHHKVPAREAAHLLMPGAGMSPAFQRKLAEAEGMEELIGQLVLWKPELCGALTKALPEYQETHKLSVLEEALDRQYFVESARRLAGSTDENDQLLHYFLQLEIDLINLRLALQRLRIDREVIIPESRFLPEGTISPRKMARLGAAPDAGAAAEMLKGTRYDDFVEALYQFMQTKRFSPVERLFERVLMNELRKLAVSDPLGLGVVMDFAWRKYNEGINLRLVARGLAGHLPPGRVREELVFS